MSNLLTPMPPLPEPQPRPKTIEGIATAEILRKRNPFARDRYTITLDIDGIDTGLHWHASRKKQATKLSQWAVDNAADILMAYGLTNLMIQKVEAVRNNLPEVGATIRLTVPLSEKFPKGTVGTVSRAEWDEADDAENRFPVLAKLKDINGNVSMGAVPLSLSEIEVIS